MLDPSHNGQSSFNVKNFFPFFFKKAPFLKKKGASFKSLFVTV